MHGGGVVHVRCGLTGALRAQFANNGIDFSADGVKFLFRAAESIDALAPSEGPTAGGTKVHPRQESRRP